MCVWWSSRCDAAVARGERAEDRVERMQPAVELLERVYEVTSERDRDDEPVIGGDFKIAVEFLLYIEEEMQEALEKAR